MTTTTWRKVQVLANGSPQTDRYVSLTTYRIFSTDVFVVGVVDGTNRLADPKSLLSTTDLTKARRHANNLTERWGGVADEPDVKHYLPHKVKQPSTRNKPPEQITRVFPVRQGRHGKYAVRWHEQGTASHRTRRFTTSTDAEEFHHRLTILMKENDR